MEEVLFPPESKFNLHIQLGERQLKARTLAIIYPAGSKTTSFLAYDWIMTGDTKKCTHLGGYIAILFAPINQLLKLSPAK